MSGFVSLIHSSVMGGVGHKNLDTSAGALERKSYTQPRRGAAHQLRTLGLLVCPSGWCDR